ncbi:WD40-repeat-containing domain protein [Aspergillus navahoensis]
MAETLDLIGAIGTWVAVLFALIALAGIIPAYILYRESQTDHYEALSLVDDKNHEYISKGYALLPGKRFFRSIKVPNLTEPPANATELAIERDCALLDRDGSPSSTAWVNFANLLRAYGVSPPEARRGGKLKILGTEALLPVHRSWILLLGLIDRYCWRYDEGLFVDEPSDPEWRAFGIDALYGLSGIMDRIHPSRDRICFRMHNITHMRSMPAYIPTHDFSPQTLFFLYLGYLPASDGSLLCSAVESESSEEVRLRVPRSGGRMRNVFYKMAVLAPNEVPVRDRRLAEEMGIQLPKIRRLGLLESTETRFRGRRERGVFMNDDGVEYFCLEEGIEMNILLHLADTQAMILAALRLDLNAQSFLCSDDLAGLFDRLLSPSDMDDLFQAAADGIGALQIRDADKQSLRTAIGEVKKHELSSAHSRGRAAALARLDESLGCLRRRYHTSQRAMEAIAILYLTKDHFRHRLNVDPRAIDPQAVFSIDIAQKKVCVPKISLFPPAEFDFDFPAVFSFDSVEEGEKILTLPLWQAMLASLHGIVKWHIWSTVHSSRDLSAFHTRLNRIVYISTHDLPDHQKDMGEQLRDVADSCREITSLLRNPRRSSYRKKGHRHRDTFSDEEESSGVDRDWYGHSDDYEDSGDHDYDHQNGKGDEAGQGDADDSYDDHNNNEGDTDNDGNDDNGNGNNDGDIEEGDGYQDGNKDSDDVLQGQGARSKVSLAHTGQQRGVRFTGAGSYNDDNVEQDHSLWPEEESPLPTAPATPNLPVCQSYGAPGNKGFSHPFRESATKDASTAGGEALAREQREERYLSVLEQLLPAHPVSGETDLTREFRKVIGPIVLMAEPLPVGSLAILLGVSTETILGQVGQLQSAVDKSVISREPIELLDVSFRDFILDPDLRQNKSFWVDENETHTTLATNCLDLLSRPGVLRKNACNLERPGHPRADISSQAIDDALPPHVQYACRHWVYHTERGECSVSDGGLVASFLGDNLLHWLEALSLMGCISEGIAMVRTLQSLATSNNRQISQFLQDAWRFLLRNREAINEAPLQLYSSAIMFLPESSVVRSAFQQHISKSVYQPPVVQPSWDSVLLSLESHSESAESESIESHRVNALTFSPDGKMLAAGTADGAIIWNPATGTVLWTLKGDGKSQVKDVAFSPDCSLLATAGCQEVVSIHDIVLEREIQRLEARSIHVRYHKVAFSEDGTLLAAGSQNGTIALWNVTKGTLVHEFEGHSDGVVALSFSPKGQGQWRGLLASASEYETTKLWDVSTGKLRRTFRRFPVPVATVVFTPDGSLLMASRNGTVKIWESSSESRSESRARTLIRSEGHDDFWGSNVDPVLLSPNGKLLAMSSAGKAHLYDTATGKKEGVVQGRLEEISSLAFSPDSTMVAAANPREGRVEIWQLTQQKATGSAFGPAEYAPSMTKYMLTLGETTEGPLEGAMVFAPSGKLLALRVPGEAAFHLWDSTTGKLIITVAALESAVECLAFSSDSRLLAIATEGCITIRELTGVNRGQAIRTRAREIEQLAFSPDCKMIASASSRGVIVCDISTGIAQQTLGVLDQVTCIEFSSDGDLLAYGLRSGMIQRWSFTTGASLPTLSGHTGPVVRVAFSSDDKILASASADGAITLWDWAAGTAKQTFSADTDITALSFCDNDRCLETSLESFSLVESNSGRPRRLSTRPKFGLNGNWVTRDGENWLCLPWDYRAVALGYHGKCVALQLKFGGVVFVGFR